MYCRRSTLNEIWQNNSNYIVSKSWRHYFICNRSYYSKSFHEFLDDIDDRLDNDDMLKEDSTTTVGRVEIDGLSLVVKRYNIKSVKHAIKRSVSPSRATKCWRNAHRLLSLNIPTAEPVAILEKRFGPFRRQAYYIYKYIDGKHANEIFLESDANDKDVIEKANQVANLMKLLKKNKIKHGDTKPENILFEKNKLYLIDLDPMRKYNSLFFMLFFSHKDTRNFMRYWEDRPKIKSLFESIFYQTCRLG